MSAIDLTAAIEAAARASWDDTRDRLALAPGGYQPPAWEDASDMTRALQIEAARVPVIAAAEVIEAAVRESIARILAEVVRRVPPARTSREGVVREAALAALDAARRCALDATS